MILAVIPKKENGYYHEVKQSNVPYISIWAGGKYIYHVHPIYANLTTHLTIQETNTYKIIQITSDDIYLKQILLEQL